MHITESGDISEFNEEQHIPSWSAYNAKFVKDERRKQKVGYPPVIPYPITDYSTVYTALCYFVDLLKQLKQDHLIITCDYEVYNIGRRIKFENSDKFKGIYPCLGGFHIIKVIEGCTGKYLTDSGVHEILTRIFGDVTVEQVLSGGNYARSVKGFTFLYEALYRLQLSSSCLRKWKFNFRVLYTTPPFNVDKRSNSSST